MFVIVAVVVAIVVADAVAVVVAVVVGRDTTATIGQYQKSNIASSFLVYYHHDHHPENNFERIFFRFQLTPLNPVFLILLLIDIATTGTTISRYRRIPMIDPPQQAVLAERILLLLLLLLLLLCYMPSFPMKLCFSYFPPPYLLLLLLLMMVHRLLYLNVIHYM